MPSHRSTSAGSRAGRARALRDSCLTTVPALVAFILGGCATGDATAPPANPAAAPASKQTAAKSPQRTATASITGQASWGFENDQVGRPPPGWLIDQTKPTTALATWKVVMDDSAPIGPHVLALTESSNDDGTFNLAIADGTSFGDLDLIVRVKAVAGREDQGGGPIWRCRDENNYYICRFNPLENNFRVYVVENGTRRQLASAPVQLAAGRWYQVGVLMIGRDITCWLDGQELLHATDETFRKPGMVGLWTKADARTSFDDLAVQAPGAP
jgi:hypothetical protein